MNYKFVLTIAESLLINIFVTSSVFPNHCSLYPNSWSQIDILITICSMVTIYCIRFTLVLDLLKKFLCLRILRAKFGYDYSWLMNIFLVIA